MRNGKANLEFCGETTILPNCDKLEMLGVTVDDMLKFDIHVSNICRKVSEEVAVLKSMQEKYTSSLYKTRKNIYTLFIVPHFSSCAQTWHFCNKVSADNANWKK